MRAGRTAGAGTIRAGWAIVAATASVGDVGNVVQYRKRYRLCPSGR
jgi:hypothetical protein